MSEQEKSLAVVESEQPREQAKVMDLFSLMPRTFDGAQQFCEVLAKSELVPKDYHDKAANIFVAIQCGAEIGLSPMQAIQSIAVINGRPSLWGDAPLGLVQGSGKLEYIKEWTEGETAFCETKRKGYPAPHVTSFSQEDAKRMGLAGKAGPWSQIPSRMRQLRARAFNLRNQFSDVLKGVSVAEEVVDITPIEQAQPEPPKPETQDEKGASVREKMQAKLQKPTEQTMTEANAASMIRGATNEAECEDVWGSLFKSFVGKQDKDVKVRLSKVYTDRMAELGKTGQLL